MPFINGQWVDEEELMALQASMIPTVGGYDRGPDAGWGLTNMGGIYGTEPVVGGEGVTPGYNPGLDASIINESMQSQAPVNTIQVPFSQASQTSSITPFASPRYTSYDKGPGWDTSAISLQSAFNPTPQEDVSYWQAPKTEAPVPQVPQRQEVAPQAQAPAFDAPRPATTADVTPVDPTLAGMGDLAMTRFERSKLQLPIGPLNPLPDLNVPAFTPLGPTRQVPARITPTIGPANDPVYDLSATDPNLQGVTPTSMAMVGTNAFGIPDRTYGPTTETVPVADPNSYPNMATAYPVTDPVSIMQAAQSVPDPVFLPPVTDFSGAPETPAAYTGELDRYGLSGWTPDLPSIPESVFDIMHDPRQELIDLVGGTTLPAPLPPMSTDDFINIAVTPRLPKTDLDKLMNKANREKAIVAKARTAPKGNLERIAAARAEKQAAAAAQRAATRQANMRAAQRKAMLARKAKAKAKLAAQKAAAAQARAAVQAQAAAQAQAQSEANAAIERVAQANALMGSRAYQESGLDGLSAAERDIVAAAQVDTFAGISGMGMGFMGSNIGQEDGGGYTGGDFSSGAGWE